MPLVPEAHFEVIRLPDSDLASFLEATGTGVERDGNAAETWAAERIQDACGRLEAPAFVLVHSGSTGHGYGYDYSDGTLSDLRIFGGAHPVIVFDASAAANDYASREPHSYSAPLAASGTMTADALVDAIRDGTAFRTLQGSIYPPALAPCHAVTVLYLVRATSASDPAGTGGAAIEAMDVKALRSAFSRITGQTVYVDLKVLRLPVDDPVLDSLYRGVAMNAGLVGVEGIVAGVFLNQARGWIEDNFDDYHVDHPGCAKYLSTVLYGDVGDLGTWGIALFENGGSHRVSFGTASEAFRTLGVDWETHLAMHETGHLLSLAHPHDPRDLDAPVVLAWGGLVSVMSYQIQERTKEPGSIDPVNLARNRAGFALQAADEAGALDTDAGRYALHLLLMNEWDAATGRLASATAEASVDS